MSTDPSITAHGLLISWKDTTDPAATFNIKRSPTMGGPYTTIGTAPAGTLSFLDTTEPAGVTQFYVVTAVLNGQESDPSNEAAATFPKAPAPPTELTISVV